MSKLSSKMPVTSAVIFVVVLAAIIVLLILTHGLAVPLAVRWVVTGLWMIGTVILGIRDLVVGGDTDSLDATAFDRWTIIHASAGLVFGLWFIPLLVVLVITIGWEVFEALVPGFGDKEIFLNRVVDVGSAVVVWLVTVVVVVLVTHASFPLLPFVH